MRRAAVLYLALEGGNGIVKRVMGIRRENGEDRGKIPFAYRRGGANLLSQDDKGDVAAIIKMHGEMMKAGTAPGLLSPIVIDTLSRALSGADENSPVDMTAFVGNVGATFGLMIWGVSVGGWWTAEMSRLFLVSAVVIGMIARLSKKKLVDGFVNGARDLLGVALIIWLARGIVILMDVGHITDTILYWAESSVAGLSQVLFINVMFWIEVVFTVIITAALSLAVLAG